MTAKKRSTYVRMPSGEIWDAAAFHGYRKSVGTRVGYTPGSDPNPDAGTQISITGVWLTEGAPVSVHLYDAADVEEADMLLNMIADAVGADRLD